LNEDAWVRADVIEEDVMHDDQAVETFDKLISGAVLLHLKSRRFDCELSTNEEEP
jgi:hypothetical protein